MYAYLTSNFLQKPQGIRMMTLMGYEIYSRLFVCLSTALVLQLIVTAIPIFLQANEGDESGDDDGMLCGCPSST